MCRGGTEASRVLVIFCFLTWELVTQASTLWENSSSEALMSCALFSYTSEESLPTQKKVFFEKLNLLIDAHSPASPSSPTHDFPRPCPCISSPKASSISLPGAAQISSAVSSFFSSFWVTLQWGLWVSFQLCRAGAVAGG